MIPMAREKQHEETKLDSVRHHEERREKLRAESEERTKVEQASAAHVAENQEIASFSGIIRDGETRDQLLDRIRKMREVPPEPEREYYVSPNQLKQLSEEQEAGRAAVAKAQAEMDRYLAARDKVEAEEAERGKKGADGPGASPQP
jgi:hypothetical protein